MENLKQKQIDIITDLLIDFDEMGFAPTTTVPNPEAYAIKWRAEITKALTDYLKQSEGEWKYDEDCECFVCSVCVHSALNNYRLLSTPSNYCPNCGAKMKGGAE